MTLKLRILVLVVCFGAFAGAAQARTFYVANSGNNRNAGTSPAHPWRTVGRVNRAHLKAGDTVLFRGGDRFANGLTLQPPDSGTAGNPIHFASYGKGRARFDNPAGNDVWLQSGRHDLSFANLDFSGGAALFASAGTGSGTYRITIAGSAFHDTPDAGLNIATYADRDWTISHCTFKHTGDSGIILWGSNVTVTHSAITDTGWNTKITWAKHGIYVKGSGAVISNNVVAGFEGNGVSLRSDNATVSGNTIHGGPDGIAYFDYAAHSGSSQILDNRIYGVTTSFYFAGDPDAITGAPPHENFTIRGNLLQANGKVNLDLTGAQTSRIVLTQNTFRGHYEVVVNAYSPKNGGHYEEEQNSIFGNGVVFVWNGATLEYAAYHATTGLGDLDRIHAASS